MLGYMRVMVYKYYYSFALHALCSWQLFSVFVDAIRVYPASIRKAVGQAEVYFCCHVQFGLQPLTAADSTKPYTFSHAQLYKSVCVCGGEDHFGMETSHESEFHLGTAVKSERVCVRAGQTCAFFSVCVCVHASAALIGIVRQQCAAANTNLSLAATAERKEQDRKTVSSLAWTLAHRPPQSSHTPMDSSPASSNLFSPHRPFTEPLLLLQSRLVQPQGNKVKLAPPSPVSLVFKGQLSLSGL